MSGDNKGFTLVEVIIAMFVLMIGMLALLNTAAVIISNNLLNAIRDEAARIGQETMDELRNDPSLPAVGWTSYSTVSRDFRGMTVSYDVYYKVVDLSSDSNTKQIDVAVGWDYKGTGSLSPTGKKYQHSVSSVIRLGS